MIQQRDNAPPPPSSLTMASLQHFDDEHPPQSMLAGTTGDNRRDLGLADMIGFGAQNNNVPDMLIEPLIEMGFTRKKAVYALQESENKTGGFNVEYAIQWLFDHPMFEPPNI